jgi:CBS domain containing-hemolysin-like protein
VTVLILSLCLAFGVSFLCSLMEAALLSLTPGQLADLRLRHPTIGTIWQQFKQDIEKPIAVILLLNTTAHTVGATMAGAEFTILFGDHRIGIFSLIFTYLMLQFTEILPKTLGVRFNQTVAVFFGYPLRFLITTLRPLVAFIHLVNRPFESRRRGATSSQLDELKALAGFARISKLISPHQELIIQRAARLSQQTAQDVMVPVAQITFLSDTQSLSDAIIAAHLDPHTRFPILSGNDRDKVLGYINFKELVYRPRTNPVDPTVKGIIRPVRFVSATDRCDEVLKVFVEEHIHMAIVRDSAGHTLGLITMEDMVEEFLGTLGDEFDRLPRMCHALSQGVWIVGGGLPVKTIGEVVGNPALTDPRGLSDWVVATQGHVPAIGETLPLGNLVLTVRRIRRGRVFEAVLSPRGLPPVE